METVAILMATYNGEEFLETQINSILNQSTKDWMLFICDDGSTDSTQEIINYYSEKHSEKIFNINKQDSPPGSKYNFIKLTQHVLEFRYKYFMYCDQDDYWEKDKIEKTLTVMEQAEKKNPEQKGKPILVHTDLYVVDKTLNVIEKSFMKYRSLNPNCKTLSRLLIQNNVTGCTIMANRELIEIAFKNLKDEEIEKIAMHDWWLAIIASTFGEIIFLKDSTIKYRQHENNVIGATKTNSVSFIVKRLTQENHVKKTFIMSIEQANFLLKKYGDKLNHEQRKVTQSLATLSEKSKFRRIKIIFDNNLFKQGFIQLLGEIIFI